MNGLLQLLSQMPAARVIPYHKAVPVDLSAQTVQDLQWPQNDAAALEKQLEHYMGQHQADLCWGGYMERRSLYDAHGLFGDKRNIHLGIDLWKAAGTPVFAAADGIVHSVSHNAGAGDYGPTIVLQHSHQNQKWHTLYGHLSLESIAGLKPGQAIVAGQSLGTLGDAQINGGYAPHLHFQLIWDLQDYVGDYPGVCADADVPFYRQNCPDPNVLLKL